MAVGKGWFGGTEQLLHFLDVMGADRDDEGNFFVAPAGAVAAGLGGQELVVSSEAVYFVGGEPRGLASGLGGTSYGTTPVVIMAGGEDSHLEADYEDRSGEVD